MDNSEEKNKGEDNTEGFNEKIWAHVSQLIHILRSVFTYRLELRGLLAFRVNI